MRIVIAGGSGMIGTALTAELVDAGYEVVVLSRESGKASQVLPKVQVIAWDGRSAAGWGQVVDGAQAVINLAGANLSGEGFLPKRWSESQRRLIRESRTNSGKALVAAIEQAHVKPEMLLQASAVGYYGPHGSEAVTEVSLPGTDFMAKVCQEWEAATAPVEALGVRRVITRSGVVFTPEGGALWRLLLPYKLFVGGPFGNGRQIMSWIHLADEVSAMRFLIEDHSARGVFNLTSPNPLPNEQVGKTIGKVMHRPHFMPVPAFAMRLAFGEVSTVVLDGQKVLPKRLLEQGYKFKFPDIEPAMRDLLGR